MKPVTHSFEWTAITSPKMRAESDRAASKVAVRLDDENPAPTIEGDDDADRDETSYVMPRSLTMHIRPSFRTVRPRTCPPRPPRPLHVPAGTTPKGAG